MIKPYQLTPVLIQLMYGTAFSLCTLITMNDLFYRKIKCPVFFPVISGLLFGAAAFIENIWFGSMILEPLFLLHTAAAFFVLPKKSRDHLLSLVLAELFSASLISSVQTAIFSVSNVTERTFIGVTLLYLSAYIIATGFVYLLKVLARSDDRESLSIPQMILLTGITA